MTNSPFITIIIPVFNAEKYLSTCIDSVLSQTFEDFEIIIVNDGSTDKSAKILDLYANQDPRISVYHKDNEGVSKTRNYGLKLAKGTWITFIDADDWVQNDFLNTINALSNKTDCILFSFQSINQSRIQERIYPNMTLKMGSIESGECFIKNELIFNGYPWGKAFKRNLIQFNNLVFNEKLSLHEDHIFLLSYYIICNSIKTTNTIGYNYRISPSSLSNTKKPYEMMSLASELFLSHTENLLNNLKVSPIPRNIKSKLGLSQKLRAIGSLYLVGNKSQRERLSILAYEKQHSFKVLCKEYSPLNVKEKIILSMFKYASIRLIDLMMSFAASNKNKY